MTGHGAAYPELREENLTAVSRRSHMRRPQFEFIGIARCPAGGNRALLVVEGRLSSHTANTALRIFQQLGRTRQALPWAPFGRSNFLNAIWPRRVEDRLRMTLGSNSFPPQHILSKVNRWASSEP